MFVDEQEHKTVCRNVLRRVKIVQIAVDEENKSVTVFVHYFNKGVFVPVQKTAVATSAVIQGDSLLLTRAFSSPFTYYTIWRAFFLMIFEKNF